MTTFELITCLPSALSCTIMQDWLSLKSVVALDSAFCCHSHRITFLNLVRSDEYHIHEQITIERKSKIFSVLPLYGEKLRSVVIEGRVLPSNEELLVRNCRNLTHVRFQGFDICTRKLLCIVNHGIILLDLNSTPLKKFEPLQIPLCPNLMSLGLGNTRLNSHFLSRFIDSCPGVVHFDVSSNSELTDADVLRIVTHWKFLRGLNIESCRKLTDACLMHIYTHCASTLHTLQMNCRIEDPEYGLFPSDPILSLAEICELLEHCTTLRTFHIGGDIRLPSVSISNITTLILKGSARNVYIDTSNNCCMKLQTLVANSYLAWDSLLHLARNCPELKEVHVYLNRYINNFWQESIESMASVLKTINPEVKFKHMHSWGKCQNHHVMSM